MNTARKEALLVLIEKLEAIDDELGQFLNEEDDELQRILNEEVGDLDRLLREEYGYLLHISTGAYGDRRPILKREDMSDKEKDILHRLHLRERIETRQHICSDLFVEASMDIEEAIYNIRKCSYYDKT